MLQEGRYTALGTMSGTSLDGVDAAVLETDGIEVFGFGAAAFRPYSEEERSCLREALGAWPGDPGVAEASDVVTKAHLDLLAGMEETDIVGFHGQTLAHDPGGRGTHQTGDGALLSDELGRTVVWDFRSNDVELGGQGAPLAPAYHFALAKYLDEQEPLAFLNLGGVGNITWVDPRAPSVEAPGAVLAFDTGPANAPLNDLVKSRRGLDFDANGALAASGGVSAEILEAFARVAYFDRKPPKSLDRNDFGSLLKAVEPLTDADAAATLTAAVATSVARAEEYFPSPVSRILVSGGGRHNALLMEMIERGLECPVEPVEFVGFNGDMLEAEAFAYLAVRIARGLPTSFPMTTGVGAAVGGGEISTPR